MKKQAYQFYSYVAITLVYLAVTFLVSPEKAVLLHYHLTLLRYRFIIATVVVPLVIIWLIAFYGFAKLQSYADTLKKAKDGKYITQLKRGIAVLVFQLPLTSAIGAMLNDIAQYHPRFVPSSTILGHYVKLIPPLVAFLYISFGARGLTETVKRRPTQRAIHLLAFSFIIIGAGFTYFAFHGVPSSPVANQPEYFLPNWLIFFTLVVPYIYTWFIGLLAAYEIYLFKTKVSGILYRRSWELLAGGLGWIILVSIVYEYVTVLSSHLTRLKVNALLLLIYAALMLLAVGYILVALGARKLQKIEEV